MPEYFRERIFGNCRSLEGAKLEKASLNRANLSGANLDSANLQNVQFGCFDFSEKPKCTNLENIEWNKYTQWQGIKGWDKVKSIPPALKKQLGLQ
jgi:uncharacterized protein YjbI with pentapeptide repeats